MKTTTRQNARRLVGILSVLVFPATFYYFSPYISIMGATIGVVSGSVLLFALLFVSSLSIGRLFCSWACPAGSIQDLVATGRGKRFDRARYHWVKYLVWAPWLGVLLFLFLRDGKPLSVEAGVATEYGLSTTSVPALISYLLVVLVFFVLCAALGRRAACHTICWMAPFMILGRSLSTAMRLPALRLRADRGGCSSCKTCDRGCPMGIEVSALVRKERPDHVDCILCGECVDHCPGTCLRFVWAAPQSIERTEE